MSINPYYLVLDDELLAFLYEIKNGTLDASSLDEKKLSNFFKFYRPYLTNIAQLNRLHAAGNINDVQLNRLSIQLGRIPSISKLSLAELATHHTNLKIILTENPSQLNTCYVDINKSIFDSHYVISKKPQESRDDLHKVLRHIFASTKFITLCDKYIPKNSSSFLKFLELLPASCRIHCNSLCKSEEFPEELEELRKKIAIEYPSLSINSDKFYSEHKFHDRYIKVDNNLEIILSSGFDYLFNKDKEISCIFRYKG